MIFSSFARIHLTDTFLFCTFIPLISSYFKVFPLTLNMP